jgi:hypothetical protein
MSSSKQPTNPVPAIHAAAQKDLVAIMTAFVFLGGYGLVAGLPIMAVGCFVGPQLVLAGMLHFVVGSAALLIRVGLRRHSAVAWWFALLFILLLIAALTWALARMVTSEPLGWEETAGESMVPLSVLLLLFWLLLRITRPRLRSLFHAANEQERCA